MWEKEKYGRCMVCSFPRISIVPHLEVLDSHHYGKRGQLEANFLELAWVIAFKLACRMQSVADIVEIIRVNFYQNVNIPEAEIFMQVSVIISPPHAEKKVIVDEHICLVSLEKNRDVNLNAHEEILEGKLVEACIKEQLQFKSSIGKLGELVSLLVDNE